MDRPTFTGTYAKLPNGSWGARVTPHETGVEPKEGDIVVLTKRSGDQDQDVLSSFVGTDVAHDNPSVVMNWKFNLKSVVDRSGGAVATPTASNQSGASAAAPVPATASNARPMVNFCPSCGINVSNYILQNSSNPSAQPTVTAQGATVMPAPAPAPTPAPAPVPVDAPKQMEVANLDDLPF